MLRRAPTRGVAACHLELQPCLFLVSATKFAARGDRHRCATNHDVGIHARDARGWNVNRKPSRPLLATHRDRSPTLPVRSAGSEQERNASRGSNSSGVARVPLNFNRACSLCRPKVRARDRHALRPPTLTSDFQDRDDRSRSGM